MIDRFDAEGVSQGSPLVAGAAVSGVDPAQDAADALSPPIKVLAIIPARGGSKGIPLKNLREVGGVSLLGRAVDTAVQASRVDDVIVSTDHPDIAREASEHGARTVARPEDLSGDTASSESALLHVLSGLDHQPEVVVFIQATSPFIDPKAIDHAVAQVQAGEADVVFAAARDHGFFWALGPEGEAVAVGHDARVRPRRQDRDPQFRETGAFYVMRSEGFLRTGHRFFGRVVIEEVPEEHAYDVDSPADLAAVQQLAAQQDR